MAFYIKKAEQKDSPLILDFIRLLAQYEKLEHEVVASEKQIEKTIFNGPATVEVFFGFEDETPVGFMLFFQNYSTFLAKPGIYLEDLYVKEEHRGKGYGKRMLHFLAKLAVERQCGRLEWAVLDWNKPAIDFYKSIGAKPMDSWIVNRLTGASLEKLAYTSLEK
jgi:GNAT superfamily N-acetyltransferase